MTRPAEPYFLTQEEQGRMLARVYAFILSDEFTGEPATEVPEKKPRRKKAAQSNGENKIVDANQAVQEPLP